MPPPPKARDLRPVRTFAKAAGACASQAQVYGACIVASYQAVEKGMCEKEFQAFKACVQDVLKRKW